MLKQSRFLHYLLWLGLFLNCFSLSAQDSVPVKKEFKNTVRFNLTNPLIFGNKSLLLGYERTFGPHQSASLSFGRASFPKPSINLLDSIGQTRIELDKSYTDKGVCVALDYRFYLKLLLAGPALREGRPPPELLLLFLIGMQYHYWVLVPLLF